MHILQDAFACRMKSSSCFNLYKRSSSSFSPGAKSDADQGRVLLWRTYDGRSSIANFRIKIFPISMHRLLKEKLLQHYCEVISFRPYQQGLIEGGMVRGTWGFTAWLCCTICSKLNSAQIFEIRDEISDEIGRKSLTCKFEIRNEIGRKSLTCKSSYREAG